LHDDFSINIQKFHRKFGTSRILAVGYTITTHPDRLKLDFTSPTPAVTIGSNAKRSAVVPVVAGPSSIAFSMPPPDIDFSHVMALEHAVPAARIGSRDALTARDGSANRSHDWMKLQWKFHDNFSVFWFGWFVLRGPIGKIGIFPNQPHPMDSLSFLAKESPILVFATAMNATSVQYSYRRSPVYRHHLDHCCPDRVQLPHSCTYHHRYRKKPNAGVDYRPCRA
jgi:hypothetical protein